MCAGGLLHFLGGSGLSLGHAELALQEYFLMLLTAFTIFSQGILQKKHVN